LQIHGVAVLAAGAAERTLRIIRSFGRLAYLQGESASAALMIWSRLGWLSALEPVRELNESLESLVIQGRGPNHFEGSPMWTNENRAHYDRSRLRYPSDLTDPEWAHVEPLIPPAKRGGNRRHVDEREVVN